MNYRLILTMRLNPVFFFYFLSLYTVLGFSQEDTLEINPSYLSIADGLASPTVMDVFQDSYGLLWIATSNGLQKYDGYKLDTFKNIPSKATSLQNNSTWGIEEDAAHNIWVATAYGPSRYNRQTNQFTNYPFYQAFNVPIDNSLVFNIFKDSQNRLWGLGLSVDLAKYDPEEDQWKFAEYAIPDSDNPPHYGHALAITEDRSGTIWFGSGIYGLMRMAKNETAFKPIPIERTGDVDFTLEANQITSLYSDANTILWITTRTGIYKYNPKTGALSTLKKYKDDLTNTYSHLNRILPDAQGNIWIANNYHGILKFEGLSDRFKELTIAGKIKMQGGDWNITITDFIIDQSGIFWLGSMEAGLLKYDPVNKPFTHLTHDEANPQSLSSNLIFGVLASTVKPGTVYVGTRGSGFNIFDPKKKTFEKITFKAKDDRYGGSVRSFAENKDGILWLGTWGDGLIKLDKNYQEIKRYKYDSLNSNSIPNNQVRILKKNKKGDVWIGTGNGLTILREATGNFQRLVTKNTKVYPHTLIKRLEEDSQTSQKVGMIDKVQDFADKSLPIEIKTAGTYWVMTVGEGDVTGLFDKGWIENATSKDTIWDFNSYDHSFYAGGADKNRMVIEPIKLEPGSYILRYKTDDSHSYDKWNANAPDQTTLYGIMLIKPRDETITETFEQMNIAYQKELLLSGNNILDIEIDDQYVWVSAQSNGLNKIDLATNTITYYRYDPKDENSLSSDNILDILEDSHGMIWLATIEGINKLDPDTDKITRYSELDGLPTNLTESILEGDNGQMWIATQNGLSQMVPNEALDKVTFINYNSSDGLGGDIFISQTAARSIDGQFYFGGDHGLTTFKSVTANNVPPALLISDLLIANKSVKEMGADSPLTQSLLDINNINLAYNQNNLSFEFAALHYANPEKNQYAHKLIGYDDDWIYDNRNFASYTNLDPRKYDFAIRASNAYGIWNEEGKILAITISPPWWKTWWAYLLYAIGLLGLGLAINSTLRRRIIIRERERSREKELAQAKEIEKAYANLKETQSQLIQSEKMASLGELTAGIAHEIQNPLNFVNNFSEINSELIAEMKEELKNGNLEEVEILANDIDENEKKIIFHGKRADGIVKGMLQHSRSGGNIKEPTDLNVLCDEYLRLSYHGLRAKDKSFNATLKTDFDPTVDKVNIIPQDMGRVILNLLTNAFYAVKEKKKNAPEDYKPTVTISTKKQEQAVIIKIEDNANGIPKSALDKIFQPFFTTKPTGQGTGLGLSMSYDIVTNAHGGTLVVATKEGIGSTFTIELPLNETAETRIHLY